MFSEHLKRGDQIANEKRWRCLSHAKSTWLRTVINLPLPEAPRYRPPLLLKTLCPAGSRQAAPALLERENHPERRRASQGKRRECSPGRPWQLLNHMLRHLGWGRVWGGLGALSHPGKEERALICSPSPSPPGCIAMPSAPLPGVLF